MIFIIQKNLITLDISFNKLTKVQGISKLIKLENFWINSNKIEYFEDLNELAGNPNITDVFFFIQIYLSLNPVS